ncbi:MAG: AAA family ATPase [Alphaproteobacteria bacterium]|nr:AAA family ATPase [Alphaproteobacteria bacterium]
MNARNFTAKPALRQEEPLLLGMIGPPGGGKTLSSLKLAKGIQSVRGGPIILIDTEGGRARKYNDMIPFEIVEFGAPCRSEDLLAAIKAQLPRNPAAIIVDSMSDEHEGEGGYLEWHDEMVPKMGGNEWAAWAKPKASRKKLISGILKIKVPLIFTFRAREKTKQNPDAKRAQDKIVNIGWQPVAPIEIVHTLDLTCILPPRANGVPVWHSDKIGEDFIIKLPNYLQPYITEGKPLSEAMGKAFAEWARGGVSPSAAGSGASASISPTHTPPEAGASFDEGDRDERWAEYCERWDVMLSGAESAEQIRSAWGSDGHKDERRKIGPTKPHLDALMAKVTARIRELGPETK